MTPISDKNQYNDTTGGFFIKLQPSSGFKWEPFFKPNGSTIFNNLFPLNRIILPKQTKLEKRFNKVLNSLSEYVEENEKELKTLTKDQLTDVRKLIGKRVVYFFESFKENLNPELLKTTIAKVSKVYDAFTDRLQEVTKKLQEATGTRAPHRFELLLQNRCSEFPLASAFIQSERASSSSSASQSNEAQLSSSSNPIPKNPKTLFNDELTKILRYAQQKEGSELLDDSQIGNGRLNQIRKKIRQKTLSFFRLFKNNLDPERLQKTMTIVGTIYDETTKIEKAKGLQNSTGFIDFLFEHAPSSPLMRHITYKEFIGSNLPAPSEDPSSNPKRSKTAAPNAAEQGTTGANVGITGIEILDEDDEKMPAASSSSNSAAASAPKPTKRKQPSENSLGAANSLSADRS
jgi:hypothetical protein